MESNSKARTALSAIIAVALLFPTFLSAQTLNEFIKQKSTQRKYLLEQIVALRAYASMAKKGYNIARDGLQTVSGFTDGEFKLHDLFFSGLETINLVIKNNPKIAEIFTMQRTTERLLVNLRFPLHLGYQQVDYLKSVRLNLIRQCEKDTDELLMITSGDITSMDDASRLEKLDKIHQEVTEKMLFARWLTEELETWNSTSQSEERSIKNLRRIYEKD